MRGESINYIIIYAHSILTSKLNGPQYTCCAILLTCDYQQVQTLPNMHQLNHMTDWHAVYNTVLYNTPTQSHDILLTGMQYIILYSIIHQLNHMTYY